MTITDNAASSQPFQAEVSELLHLMVHSVYSETDIFLRELISNASDACDKLRYEAIAKPELMADGAPLAIRIRPDAKAGTLAIFDQRGVGDRLIAQLVARIGSVGDQLAQEDVGFRIDRMHHQVQQFGNLGLKGLG